MAVPGATGWNELDVDEKRARVLRVADELFAREGIEVSVPTLAAAVGVGVGSLYRLFPGKEDIVAALLLARMEAIIAELDGAASASDPREGLERVVASIAGHAVSDSMAHHAWERVSERPDVARARERTRAGLEAIVARARDAGALRADATADDLRLAFMAARSAEELKAGGAQRLAALVLRGLSA